MPPRHKVHEIAGRLTVNQNRSHEVHIFREHLFLFVLQNQRAQDTLSQKDIQFIRDLGILDANERIIDFYSEYRIRNSGNFYTAKRVAKYWIDERNPERNQLVSAQYNEIIAVDTVYNAGVTYCPHLLIVKSDSTVFKVCKDGSREEIAAFFEGVLNEWAKYKRTEIKH